MKARPQLAALALTLVSLAALGGCTSPNPGRVDVITRENFPNIGCTNGVWANTVYGEPVVRMVPGEPMTVSVPVRNVSLLNDPLHVKYHFIFYDAAHLPIEPIMGYRNVSLPQKVQSYLKASAMDDRAVDWRLEVVGQ